MTTLKEKKAFALKAIRPYAKDPSLCGYDKVEKRCMYLTKDGKKCVAGKYMIDPKDKACGIGDILKYHNQSEVFIPEAVDVLTETEWIMLQAIHDLIARGKEGLKLYIDQLGLFTYEEMMTNE